ncbi:DUF1292 domain-containing protein [Lagierella sp.]|uniref:DUF1292 domain-containing protein n=1 Tax=Lagierella sp. TaxID=2849657 RepID=UPI00262E03B9|nr:DUF1292 domain-containing protein [Lagierella sp.]
MEIIELYNEDNEIEEYYLQDSFGIEDEDYVVLKSIDKEDEMNYIYKTHTNDKGELIFEGIESDKELNDIVEIYLELKENDVSKGGDSNGFR